MFWPKTQNLLNLSLTQFLICCVWRSQILRHWRIIDDLLARNLRPRNNQWDPENWNQCILWPPDPPDRQGSQDTSGHQDTSSDHFIESEDLDGKPSETATVWKRSRKCRRVAWKKELQRFIGTSLGENGKSGRIKNRTAKAEAKQTRHKVHLSASLCKFGKRVWLGYLGDTCKLGTKL